MADVHPALHLGRKTRLAPSVVACLTLFSCLGLIDHDLWTPDEPRVAAIAREVCEGSWIVPTLNGKPFLEEPPLHVWCVAVVYGILGYDPPGIGRLVSALFGIGKVVLGGPSRGRWTLLVRIQRAEARGLLERRDDRWQPTARGRQFLNDLQELFLPV